MKKINPKLRKLVIAFAQKHAWNIGVSHYKMDVYYAKDDKKNDMSNETAAEMDVDRRYLKANMIIFPVAVKNWKEKGNTYLEKIVAHEVAHIATQHFFDVAVATYRDEGEMKDAWETCTEVIGQLSLQVRSKEVSKV